MHHFANASAAVWQASPPSLAFLHVDWFHSSWRPESVQLPAEEGCFAEYMVSELPSCSRQVRPSPPSTPEQQCISAGLTAFHLDQPRATSKAQKHLSHTMEELTEELSWLGLQQLNRFDAKC